MENRPKTIIVDIDGTLLWHFGSIHEQMTKEPCVLRGVQKKFDEWDRKGYRIILLTGRKESLRKLTEKQLRSCCIFYDQLVMGVGGGVRVLINDLKANDNEPTAVAICVERNKGIEEVNV
jgi:uncharacterized HAD superfamily protein